MEQITNKIMMVRPVSFGYNEETAKNNSFQTPPTASEELIKQQAIIEFDQFVTTLKESGVDVMVIEDSLTHLKPDAVFPNNWISLHENGLIITYPMFSPIRRKERRKGILEILKNKFQLKGRIHLEGAEVNNSFLEGTGSMILDRKNKIVYANRSIRTDEKLLKIWADFMDYKVVLFDAYDQNGDSIYHTNVLMSLGTDFCVICFDAIPESEEKKSLIDSLHQTKKEIIEISLEQMNKFAGNMLQVKGKDNNTFLVMSLQAFNSLNPNQLSQITKHTTPLYADLNTIETYGGGSARCMMAEIFLEKV